MTQLNVLSRTIGPRGPLFYHEGRKLMFKHQLDGSNVIGPRLATDEDKAAHPEAYALAVAEK